MKKFYFMFLCFFTVICISFETLCTSSNYTWATISPSIDVSSHEILENGSQDSSNPLNLDCGSCILIEQTTGQVLYSYNAHEKLAPASVTKLMSIYLIMEAISNRKNKL